MADLISSHSRFYITTRCSFDLLSQFRSHLRFHNEREEISGMRTELVRDCRPIAFFPAPLLNSWLFFIFRNYPIYYRRISPFVVRTLISLVRIVSYNTWIVVLVEQRRFPSESAGR
jgi:hypothetical protein